MREWSKRGRVRKPGTARSFSTARRFRRRRRLAAVGASLLVVLTTLLLPLALRRGGEPEPPPAGERSVPALPEGVSPAAAAAPPPPPKPEREPLPAPEASCDDLRVLVDRDHPLPPSYTPGDLDSLNAWGVPTLGEDMALRRGAARQLNRLVADAGEAGQELVVASAYRSYADQQASYDNWTAYYGEGAGGVSAPPGHSQHQLGTAVDFTNADAGYKLHWPFGDTGASAWLLGNAHRYGYVIAYPSLAEHEETGYSWEPWHYRYVGVENARRWKESGLGLQAFLKQESVLPLCNG